MSYTKIFAYLRGQKAFTAFLTTLIVIGSLSAALSAKGASAEVVLLNVTDLLSTSEPSTGAMHTITFTPTLSIGGNQDIDITFPAGFVVPAFTFSNFTMASTSAYTPVAACAPGAGNVAISVASQVVSIRTCVDSSIASGTPVTIALGIGSTKVTNPTVGSYEISIRNATTLQSQKLRVMILSKVLMTAAVDPILQFNVYGTSTGVAFNATNTSTSTTATTIDFGKLTPNVAYTAAQDLEVSTNARTGFAVTARTDSEFKSANGATIDGFNYSASTTPVVWNAPAATLNNDRTWGNIGISTSDITDTAIATPGHWLGSFIENPIKVMSFSSSTRLYRQTVGYQVQISDLQEAATDYKTNIVYVATPVF
jgi:hypothetical protein